jgi:hypothetical protein
MRDKGDMEGRANEKEKKGKITVDRLVEWLKSGHL